MDEAGFLIRESGPDSYSPTDPGPPRAALTKWLHARLEQVKRETEAGAVGWHAVLSKQVTPTQDFPLKPQRDRLRRTHPALEGWQFRVLTEWRGDVRLHTLWAHYGHEGSSGARTAVVAQDPAQRVPEQPEPGDRGPAPPLAPRKAVPPPPPFQGALRGGLVGMDWADDEDEMPTREVPE